MILAALLTGAVSFAQPGLDENISWKTQVNQKDGGVYQVVFTGAIAPGHYTYAIDDPYSAPSFREINVSGGELEGSLYAVNEPKTEADGSKHYYGKIVLAQDVKAAEEGAVVSGVLFTNICTESTCSADYYDFNVKVGAPAAQKATETAFSPAEADAEESESKPLWGLIIEAILWGFAMLLTPCVFPMVPMTVSFFMKGSENQAAGRFKAAMYGLFIVLLYTVPTIGPVHENETSTRVSAMKNTPARPFLSAPLSLLFTSDCGIVISNAPKNEAAKIMNTTKKMMFGSQCVESQLKMSAVTASPPIQRVSIMITKIGTVYRSTMNRPYMAALKRPAA